ncbi:DPH6-like protein [Mya arenaria]|uniref:Diphthine--ammonia ligase n=1 Tax=Mya arenaria TaxID=6604 RepID=A0ABY7FAV1_MYAAR|nr:DPH6-like protein [Mya arenaria]
MKVVALISGGKDSCYNMMQCVAEGHQIVAIANLKPKHKDELDSYMYQTVGHHAINLYAEAMGLPLYRREIEGSSQATGRDYQPTHDDEVEDLYELLKTVKQAEQDVEGVAVGAILSNYQRVRVENVELLEEMIQCRVNAVLIKVAAMGLYPKKHLGKSLSEMQDYLLKKSTEFDLNVCGEGGEFETFTLDCPLFNKAIVLSILQVDSSSQTSGNHLWLTNLIAYIDNGPDIASQTQTLMVNLQDTLTSLDDHWSLADLVLVHLYVRDMADFAAVNAVYKKYFGLNPAARVCVQTDLPDNVSLMMDCYGNSNQSDRDTMHVQGLSHWAPANIGPYSQCVRVQNRLYVAGQIGMVPTSLAMVEGGVRAQARLSLRHVARVLAAMVTNYRLDNLVTCVCYLTHSSYISVAKEELQGTAPESALIEWQVVAHIEAGGHKTTDSRTKCDLDPKETVDLLLSCWKAAVQDTENQSLCEPFIGSRRVFYPASLFAYEQLYEALKSHFEEEPFSLVPVTQLETCNLILALAT